MVFDAIKLIKGPFNVIIWRKVMFFSTVTVMVEDWALGAAAIRLGCYSNRLWGNAHPCIDDKKNEGIRDSVRDR